MQDCVLFTEAEIALLASGGIYKSFGFYGPSDFMGQFLVFEVPDVVGE